MASDRERLTALKRRRTAFDHALEALPDASLYTCPCCGYPTLPERCAFEICSVCGWEDDGQDDADADQVTSGPNASSLTEARLDFARELEDPATERLLLVNGGRRPDTHEALLVDHLHLAAGDDADDDEDELELDDGGLIEAIDAVLETFVDRMSAGGTLIDEDRFAALRRLALPMHRIN